MTVQKLRLEKGWSQEHLAQVSGLSVRTVQRIERGQKAGPESLKCLAAVFELDVASLAQEQLEASGRPNDKSVPSREEKDSTTYIDNLKAFHMNWIAFLVVMPALYALNLYVSPGFLWVIIAAVGWGIGIILHALIIFGLFNIFDKNWEQDQIEKRKERRGR